MPGRSCRSRKAGVDTILCCFCKHRESLPRKGKPVTTKRDSPVGVENAQHAQIQIHMQRDEQPHKKGKYINPSETISHIKAHLQKAYAQAMKAVASDTMGSAACEIMEAINQLP